MTFHHMQTDLLAKEYHHKHNEMTWREARKLIWGKVRELGLEATRRWVKEEQNGAQST